jgi:hypothetical protein
LDRGEGIETTPDELMDGIEKELGLSAKVNPSTIPAKPVGTLRYPPPLDR